MRKEVNFTDNEKLALNDYLMRYAEDKEEEKLRRSESLRTAQKKHREKYSYLRVAVDKELLSQFKDTANEQGLSQAEAIRLLIVDFLA